jgi:hypothetical protein
LNRPLTKQLAIVSSLASRRATIVRGHAGSIARYRPDHGRVLIISGLGFGLKRND